MKTIKYKNLEIIPIMREMIIWNANEAYAEERFVLCKIKNNKYPYMTISTKHDYDSFMNAKEIPQSETKPRTIQDGLQYGDVIYRNGVERAVLGICDDVIFASSATDKTKAFCFNTLQELTADNWKLKQTQEPKSITIQEAQELLKEKGIDNIKIQ